MATLLKMAREDESPLVRPAAVEAIGLVGDPRMIDKLLPFVDDGTPICVQPLPMR